MAVLAAILVLLTACQLASPVDSEPDQEDIELTVNQSQLKNLDLYRNYTLTVTTGTAPSNTYSSFLVQAHSQTHVLVLTNGSNYCVSVPDQSCTAVGSNIGLVQIWNEDARQFPFRVRMECKSNDCLNNNSTAIVLLAAIGIPKAAPIPGGCTLTSNLFIDPNLRLNYTSYSTDVHFQTSDVGFSPENESYPTCDGPSVSPTGPYNLEYLEYTVYQKCLGRGVFGASSAMSAVRDMLTARHTQEQESSYTTIKYDDLKKLTFASTPGQGVVYNVIAKDKRTGHTTAYVPALTYACDIHTSDCQDRLKPFSGIAGVALMLCGLLLCLIGHNFFHGEVFLIHLIAGCYISFMLISMANSSLFQLSLLFGTLYSILWFLFWFLTGWYWFHVVAFGFYGDFILTAAVLYSPLEDTSVFTVLQISYVYYLTLFCGIVLFMVPLIAFPRALSVWASSLVGSYCIVFGVGMFTYTQLSDIVLLVAKKISLPGLYSAHIDCPLMTNDYILIAVWAMLLVTGVTIQTVIVQIRRTKHNRRQRNISNVKLRTKFSSFPQTSLLKRLLRRRGNLRCSEGEPLLTPNHLPRSNRWSSTNSPRLPGNGSWLPNNSGSYPGNYGATGATTVYEPVVYR